MHWTVELHDQFDSEFAALSVDVQDKLLETAKVLSQIGPSLPRPYTDKLKGSKHANMKELRFTAGEGVWRVAFAFDPARRAILLVAGDKSGANQRRFYGRLIAKADQRFDEHLETLKGL